MATEKVLVALDGSENSGRAVEYVGRLVASGAGLVVALLHVERPPDRDFFASEEAWAEAGKERMAEMKKFLAWACEHLREQGLSPDRIEEIYMASCRSPVRPMAEMCSLGTSIARDILKVQEEGGYNTLVIGRRGVSKAEEFLFGSVTTKVIHLAKNCTVWVVQ
ncbi:MAG: universal stress protein [Deltaproteobacteria bacterium]|nr:universal stress protein [Deltaproteobacteria bacterium]